MPFSRRLVLVLSLGLSLGAGCISEPREGGFVDIDPSVQEVRVARAHVTDDKLNVYVEFVPQPGVQLRVESGEWRAPARQDVEVHLDVEYSNRLILVVPCRHLPEEHGTFLALVKPGGEYVLPIDLPGCDDPEAARIG